MATFTFEEQRVIIRFLHLRGMKPIEIHQQLSETCNDGIMDVKNMRSWVRQFTEGRTSCEKKPKEPPPHTSWSEDMIAQVEQMVMEDRRIACLTQLLMNFDGFHATKVEESDNHALLLECKSRHFQYLKHYCHSTTSKAFNS